MTRKTVVLAALACAWGWGCGSDAPSPGTTSASTGGPSTSGAGAASAGGGSATGGATSGAGGQGAGGGTTASDYRVVLDVSSSALLTEAGEGALKARCVVLDAGLPTPDEVKTTLVVSPLDGVTEKDAGPGFGTYSFASYGVHELTCTAEVKGESLTVTREVAVLNDAIEPSVAHLGEGLGGLAGGLLAVMFADGGQDQDLVAAVDQIDGAAVQLKPADYAKYDDVLRQVPFGYPSADQLMTLGIMPTADDAAYPAAMAKVASELDALKSLYQGLDPTALSMADRASVQARQQTLDAALAALSKLDVSTHGHLTQSKSLANLLFDHLAPALEAVANYSSQLMRHEAAALFPQADASANDGKSKHFGLLSATLGMFNQNHLIVRSINTIYGPIIAELDKSINNLILLKAIDYALPPNPKAPVIEYNFASASLGFSKVGYNWAVEGTGFNKDPDLNLMIVVGDGWQTVVANTLDLCGLKDAKSLPAAIAAVKSCVEDATSAVDESLANGNALKSGLLSEQRLELGPFPKACSGSLPLAIGIIPVNLVVGRGPTFLSNCLL